MFIRFHFMGCNDYVIDPIILTQHIFDDTKPFKLRENRNAQLKQQLNGNFLSTRSIKKDVHCIKKSKEALIFLDSTY